VRSTTIQYDIEHAKLVLKRKRRNQEEKKRLHLKPVCRNNDQHSGKAKRQNVAEKLFEKEKKRKGTKAV